MSWDDKGWHQYNHGFSVHYGGIQKHVCKDCNCAKTEHLSQVDYVTDRLLHGKRQPETWQGPTWEELIRKTNAFIAPLAARQMGTTRMQIAMQLHQQGDLSRKQLFDVLDKI